MLYNYNIFFNLGAHLHGKRTAGTAVERIRYSGQLAVPESDRHVEQQDTRNSRQGLSSRATRGASHTRLQ